MTPTALTLTPNLGLDPHLPTPHAPPHPRPPTDLPALARGPMLHRQNPRLANPASAPSRLHGHHPRAGVGGPGAEDGDGAAAADSGVEETVSGRGVCGEAVVAGWEGVDERWGHEWVGYDGGVL